MLQQQDKMMILTSSEMCLMWLAANYKPEHGEEMTRIELRKCGLAMSELLDLDFGMEESATWPSSKIAELIDNNIHRLRKVTDEMRGSNGHDAS